MLQGRDQIGSHTYNTVALIKYTNSVKDRLTISETITITRNLIMDSVKVYDKPSIAVSKCTLRRISMNLDTSLHAGRPYEHRGAVRKKADQNHYEQEQRGMKG